MKKVKDALAPFYEHSGSSERDPFWLWMSGYKEGPFNYMAGQENRAVNHADRLLEAQVRRVVLNVVWWEIWDVMGGN